MPAGKVTVLPVKSNVEDKSPAAILPSGSPPVVSPVMVPEPLIVIGISPP